MPSPIRPINVNLGHLATNRVQPPRMPTPRTQPQSQAANVNLSPAALASQGELDAIKTQIGDLVDNRGGSGSGFRVEDVYSGLSRFRVGSVDLNPDQFVDLDVEVTASAQQGTLFLSFGAASLSFDAGTSSLSLEITGSLGSLEMYFTHGTSVAEAAQAINTFTETTGVTATMSGTGIVLESSDYGSSEFVSVKSGGDATFAASAATGGVYGVQANDAETADVTAQTLFASLINPVTDHGQDIAATVNDLAIIGDGTVLTYTGQFLTAQLDLKLGDLGQGETANAQHLGSFLAGRVLWDGSITPFSDTPPGIDLSG